MAGGQRSSIWRLTESTPSRYVPVALSRLCARCVGSQHCRDTLRHQRVRDQKRLEDCGMLGED